MDRYSVTCGCRRVGGRISQKSRYHKQSENCDRSFTFDHGCFAHPYVALAGTPVDTTRLPAGYVCRGADAFFRAFWISR